MTEAKTKTPQIYGAILNVMKGLASIPKNGKMKFGNTSYDYLKADDVQEKLNPLLVANGIVVKSDYTVETLDRGRGEGSPYVYVHLMLTYVSVKDGSEMTVAAVGESQATDDKSINKALTQALKNCHRATFQFASGEPEPDDVGPAPAPSRAVQQATKVTRPAPKASGGTSLNKVKDHIRATYLKENPRASSEVKKVVDAVKAEGKIKDEVEIYKEVAERLGVPYGTK